VTSDDPQGHAPEAGEAGERTQRHAAAPARQLRVPDFFIVGHHKSGTTALYEMLRRHPQIFMPGLKEPRFFASDMRSRFQPKRGHVLPETLDEYLSLFAPATPEQRTGEASPSYLMSHTAARRIADVQPAGRIIAILREPAEFLRSLHLELTRSHVETKKDLRTAISLEAARREGRRVPRRSHRPQLLQYSEQVRYVEQLRRFSAQFPPEQTLVLIYDDFRADNEATVRRVLRFLEVDDGHPIEALNVHATTHSVRSQQLDDLVYSVALGRGPISRAAKATVKALAPRRLRREAFRTVQRRFVHTDPPATNERFMMELRHRFKPEVVALSEYLDRDLVSLWGYDELD
jgi:Sulfotransferase family